MSVTKDEYVIVGVNIGYDNFDSEKDEDLMLYGGVDKFGSGSNPFGVLYDGMNGKYAIAGKVIAHGDMYDGTDLTSITVPEIAHVQVEVAKWLKEKELVKEPYLIQIYIVSHFH